MKRICPRNVWCWNRRRGRLPLHQNGNLRVRVWTPAPPGNLWSQVAKKITSDFHPKQCAFIHKEIDRISACLHEMLITHSNQICQSINDSTALKIQFHHPPERAACPIRSFSPQVGQSCVRMDGRILKKIWVFSS